MAFIGPFAREIAQRRKAALAARLEEFYNQCHDEDGRFCEGEDGPGRVRDNKKTVGRRGYEATGFITGDPKYLTVDQIKELEFSHGSKKNRIPGNGLDAIEHDLHGIGISKHQDDRLITPMTAKPGRDGHVRYQANALGLHDELIADNGAGLKQLFREGRVLDEIQRLETGERTGVKNMGLPGNVLVIFDTKDQFGVDLKIPINVENNHPSTIMPYSRELDDYYREIAGDLRDRQRNHLASRVTRALAKQSIDSLRKDRTGQDPVVDLWLVQNGRVEPYNLQDRPQ